MDADIHMLDSGNEIKNGTRIVATGGRGSFALNYKTNDNDVSNKPEIEDIQYKYDERLDDPRYYGGDTED